MMSCVKTLPSADVLETLNNAPGGVVTTIIDPWYNKGIGGYREDYNDWLSDVIAAAARVSQHIFVWGFPEIFAHQIARIPLGLKLTAWLTWYYKNCPALSAEHELELVDPEHRMSNRGAYFRDSKD